MRSTEPGKSLNPINSEAKKQVCSWDSQLKSWSSASFALDPDKLCVRITLTELRIDRKYTQHISHTLDRDEILEVIKLVSRVI